MLDKYHLRDKYRRRDPAPDIAVATASGKEPRLHHPFPAHYACEEVLAFCGCVYVYAVSQQWRLPMCKPEPDYLHEWRC